MTFASLLQIQSKEGIIEQNVPTKKLQFTSWSRRGYHNDRSKEHEKSKCLRKIYKSQCAICDKAL